MIEVLDILVLTSPLREHGLEAGALGTAVYAYPDGSCEAEFVSPTGVTLAVVTLAPEQFRVTDLSASRPAEAGPRPS